jgi:hypothetical protein
VRNPPVGQRIFRFAMAAAVAGIVTALAACGGSASGGNGSPAAPTTGTVGILLRDGPTDAFCQILATVERIDLLGSGSPTNIFMGPETLDILALKNYTDVVTVATEVAIGEYSKVRLTLSDLALVECNDVGVAEPESQWEHPTLPGNGKLDLNPRGSFQVIGGETLLIQLDVDMEKSLHVHQTGDGKWQFRPVIFVDIIPDGERLVRVFGQVRDVDGMTFELCPLEPASSTDDDSNGMSGDMSGDDDSGRCLDVFTDGSSGIFDPGGDPVGVDQVVDGGLLTAIGFLSLHDDDDDADSRHDDLRLDAVVLELGDQGSFERIRGVVTTAPGNNDIFEFDPAAVPDATDLIDVLLQAGTRIFALGSSDELTAAAIQPDTAGEVDGVFTDPTTEPVTQPLKASLVVLDVDSTPGQSILDATVAAIVPDDDAVAETRRIEVNTSAVTGQCVTTDLATRYLTITEMAASSETVESDFNMLGVGSDVDVFGSNDTTNAGCVLASVIQKYVAAP